MKYWHAYYPLKTPNHYVMADWYKINLILILSLQYITFTNLFLNISCHATTCILFYNNNNAVAACLMLGKILACNCIVQIAAQWEMGDEKRVQHIAQSWKEKISEYMGAYHMHVYVCWYDTHYG